MIENHQTTQTNFDQLPNELITHIISYLSTLERNKTRLTSKLFNDICEELNLKFPDELKKIKTLAELNKLLRESTKSIINKINKDKNSSTKISSFKNLLNSFSSGLIFKKPNPIEDIKKMIEDMQEKMKNIEEETQQEQKTKKI